MSYWTHHPLEKNCPSWVEMETKIPGSFSLPASMGMSMWAFYIWHEKGLQCYNYFFINNKFTSFEQLAQTFFRYLQFSHFVKTIIPQFPIKSPDNIINTIMSSNSTGKWGVSSILGSISAGNNKYMSYIRTAWESDIKTSIDEGTWINILKQVHSSSVCSTLFASV